MRRFRRSRPSRDLDDQIERSVRALVSDLYPLIEEAALDAVREVLAAGRPARGSHSVAAVADGTGAQRMLFDAGLEDIPPADGQRSESTRQGMAVLLQFLREYPGSRMEHITKALKTNREALRRPMARLLARGAVQRTGWSRGAKYFLPAMSRSPGHYP